MALLTSPITNEDLRFEYVSLFKKYTKCLNLVFPAKEALAFMAKFERQ
jgi:type I restriction enzyme, R subunit